jgi:hypothetical protein
MKRNQRGFDQPLPKPSDIVTVPSQCLVTVRSTFSTTSARMRA